jgi:hypothetical protein
VSDCYSGNIERQVETDDEPASLIAVSHKYILPKLGNCQQLKPVPLGIAPKSKRLFAGETLGVEKDPLSLEFLITPDLKESKAKLLGSVD